MKYTLLTTILFSLSTLLMSACGTDKTKAEKTGEDKVETRETSARVLPLEGKKLKIDHLIKNVWTSSDYLNQSASAQEKTRNNLQSWQQMIQVNLEELNEKLKNYNLTNDQKQNLIDKHSSTQDSLQNIIQNWKNYQ